MVMLSLLALTIAANPACAPTRPAAQLATAASPYDSTMATVGTAQVKICYSRPSLKGRTAVGGTLAPFGKVWRTGANEPTILHTSGAIIVGGVRLAAGRYSIYTIPGEKSWTVMLNKSTTQWGTSYPQAQDVGRAEAAPKAVAAPIEKFTITLSSSAMTLAWEKTSVTVPVAAAK